MPSGPNYLIYLYFKKKNSLPLGQQMPQLGQTLLLGTLQLAEMEQSL